MKKFVKHNGQLFDPMKMHCPILHQDLILKGLKLYQLIIPPLEFVTMDVGPTHNSQFICATILKIHRSPKYACVVFVYHTVLGACFISSLCGLCCLVGRHQAQTSPGVPCCHAPSHGIHQCARTIIYDQQLSSNGMILYDLLGLNRCVAKLKQTLSTRWAGPLLPS